MTRRRVVVALPDPPLPFGNAAARWYYVLVRDLPARGYDVTTFAACRSQADRTEVANLLPPDEYDVRLYAPEPRGVLRGKWETLRRPHAYVFSDALRRDLAAAIAARPDIVHCEALWTGWLGAPHAARALLNVHYLFEIDLEAAPASPVERIRRLHARWAAGRILRAFSEIVTLTPRLTERVAQIAPQARVTTVPLALDASHYPFEEREPPGATPVVTLIGSFNWFPTRAAGERLLTRLWPEIVRRVPQARLQLVGRQADVALRRWAGTPGVAIYPDVPDILPYFRRSDLLIYPAAGASGMKVKVLEAFALGVPVVTTWDGVEGLPAEDGVHAGIADDDAALVDRAVRLLTDGAAWRRTRHAARELVETHCGPGPVLDQFEHVYERILAP